MRSFIKSTVVVAVAAMWIVSAAQAAPIVLKASILQPEGDPSVVAFREGFKKHLEEKTNGKYRVDIFTGGSLGNADSVVQGIQFGTLHFATESLANFSQFLPKLGVFDLPYLLLDRESVTKMYQSPVGQNLFKDFEKRGIKVLDLWLSTFRALCTTKPITKIEDTQGVKIRTTGSKWHMSSIQSLGLNPTPMPPTEIITGLQQGVITGTDTEYPSIVSWNFIDVAKHVTLSEHIPCLWVLFTNDKWMKKLPEDDRKIIEECIALYNKLLLEEYDKQVDAVLRDIVEKYNGHIYRLSPEEKKRWVEKSSSIYANIPKEMKTLVDEIRSSIK